MEISELYKKQISLTEWLEGIEHTELDTLRKEDNDKRSRLELLHEYAGIQVDEVFHFSGEDVATMSKTFLSFYESRKNKQCAFRLVPTEESLPKLRMRGMTVESAVNWSKEQQYDPKKYRVEVASIPNKAFFSTIFIVSRHGIFGEIITGAHYKLTQGFYEGEERPTSFSFVFNSSGELVGDDIDNSYKKPLEEIKKSLYIGDEKIQQLLIEKLGATFCHNYLMGYFETVTSDDYGLWYIDYNRLLGEKYNDFTYLKTTKTQENDSALHGKIASPGVVKGKVKLVKAENALQTILNDDEILVCTMTTPIFIQLIKKAAAIVTDDGGILSHAAIISRELKKPCIVGTRVATQVLKDEDLIEVNANRGIVTILSGRLKNSKAL